MAGSLRLVREFIEAVDAHKMGECVLCEKRLTAAETEVISLCTSCLERMADEFVKVLGGDR